MEIIVGKVLMFYGVYKVLKQWMLNATVYILVIACFIGEEKQKTQTKD
jgi:hypothetical protein